MRTGTKERKGLRMTLKKRSPLRFLFRTALLGIMALILWCGYVFIVINQYGNSNTVTKADAAIVLGAALWNDVPSPALRERLELASKLVENHTVDKLILSGGLGSNGSTKTEAEGMRDYLLAKGIQADKLLLEDKAVNTYENLLFSAAIAKEQGLSGIIIVTHDYHAARALDIAKYIGYNSPQVYAGASSVLNPYYNKGREVLAYTKWQLDKLLDWMGIQSL